MKWIQLLRNKNYALLQSETDTQYCVANNYDPTQPEDQQWSHGSYFTYQNAMQKAIALTNALDEFRYKTEDDYLTYSRAIELATQFKDCALEDEDLAYVIDNMDENEIEFFGLNEVNGDIL